MQDVKKIAPISFENWRAYLNSDNLVETSEYPLYTDAHITGELTENLGPYKLFNTIPLYMNNLDIPSLVLRLDYYLEYDHSKIKMDKTDTSRYHGGDIVDEIAALVSLCFGFRLMAGGVTREFRIDDPKGRPVSYGSFVKQPLTFRKQDKRFILPQKLGTFNLLPNSLLTRFSELDEEDANELVRAARSYQTGLWISEYQPELSWIMFVSAVETVAGRWRKEKYDPVERLQIFKPSLVKILDEQGGIELVKSVANEISDFVGATKTFVDFILEYFPEEPKERPPIHSRIDWTKKSFNKYLRQIYKYRSNALHGGTPFPSPMSEPPMKFEGKFLERPAGLATSSHNAVWTQKDLPMLLHTFEYVVRNSIINWWKSLYENA